MNQGTRDARDGRAAGAESARLECWGVRLRWPMVAVALASLPVIVLDESRLGAPWDAVAGAANWLIWLAFAIETIVMLALAPEKWRWLRHHPLEAAIVLLTPPFLPPSLQAARVFRLLLVLRALAAASVVRSVLSVAGLRYVALLAVVTVLGGGTAFAAVEHAQGLTAWDGVWWAIVTVTTVGYGDRSETASSRGGSSIRRRSRTEAHPTASPAAAPPAATTMQLAAAAGSETSA